MYSLERIRERDNKLLSYGNGRKRPATVNTTKIHKQEAFSLKPPLSLVSLQLQTPWTLIC